MAYVNANIPEEPYYIVVGGSTLDLRFCNFKCTKTNTKMRDPYDLSREVEVEYNTLVVTSIPTGRSCSIDLLNREDPTIIKIDRYLNQHGLKIDFVKGDVVYLDE